MNIFIKSILTFCSISITALSFAQTCNNKTFNDITAEQFIDLENGVAVDKKTGLMWQVCTLGQTFQDGTCIDSAITFNWLTAFEFANQNQLAGFENWRLPNIKELTSIQKLSCVNPAVENSVFIGIESSYYWTATPSNISGRIWAINFADGLSFADDKTTEYYVLLVRDITQ
ncbi:DUF1566 domain-containing protein [Marinicellulosiphila megalodicopiae]|uniref:Lcl C-terminal domain-containing protein n=1 Tax=Marinicellulosiphila megalodicopiae TaxID=2724896 RepID=UPI003BAF46C3